MSLNEYSEGMTIAAKEPPFNALIYAAMRKANPENLEILKYAWPYIWVEYEMRSDCVGGLLESEKEKKR